ncbi:zinc ribbon domain-containing protein [Cupriavidus taiwanensis]|uniref:Zinc ribbon domain-containing protein n=1 Tax=Cupriavidus taiwanensis TaxID=164546 RepID=A0A375J2W3_9BURK|nr:zinc ribbon domain-containing protein [Cupriavidus taiwanensis]SPR99535.1 conserved hypothetical protein [Cupriavidus taiwanensis]
MALVKCKECKKEVSSKAKLCPHCGVKNPSVGTKETLVGLFVVLMGVVMLTQCMGGSKDGDAGKADAPSNETAEQIAAKEAACKSDLQCWGDKHVIAASVACAPEVEKLAKYSHKWTDGMMDTKFPRFRWANKDHSAVTYIGDKIQFQNGFGAMQNHLYHCDYDPLAKQVLNVRAAPGRL